MRDTQRGTIDGVLTVVAYTGLAIAVVALLFFVTAQFFPAGEQIAPPVRDEPIWELPTDHPVTPAEVETARLPVALRGYRFAETDQLLDRLAAEIRARDEYIAALQLGAPSYPPEDEVFSDFSDFEDYEDAGDTDDTGDTEGTDDPDDE
jgi:hypothetical protein